METEWITPGGERDKGELSIVDTGLVKNDDNSIILNDLRVDTESEAVTKPQKTTLAKRFVELTSQGYQPGEAAKTCGTTLKGLQADSTFKKQVQKLIELHSLGPEVRRALVRAGVNQIFVDNISKPDPGSQKLALDAAKVIGSDTEVGINAPPQVGININMGDLTTVFAALDKDREENNGQ